MKQIRIYVNNKFQFAVSVQQSETYADVAKRARQNMALSENFTPKFAPGLINFTVS